MPIVTVEVVPGLSLGTPQLATLGQDRVADVVNGWSSSNREAGRFVEDRQNEPVQAHQPPTSGPQTPFLQPQSALGAGRQAIRVRGLLVSSPGASATRVYSLQAQGWKQAQASRHSWWEGPGSRQPRGPLLTATSAATTVTPLGGYPRQLAALG